MPTDTPTLQKLSNAAIKKARQSQSFSKDLDEILSLFNARLRNLESTQHYPIRDNDLRMGVNRLLAEHGIVIDE